MDNDQKLPISLEGDRVDLLRLNRIWLESYVAKDADAISNILADDFVAIYGGGTRRTKSEVLRQLAELEDAPSLARTEHLAVHVARDVGVVSARAVVQVPSAGGGSEEILHDYADIYARRDGSWQAVSAHIVVVSGPHSTTSPS